MSRKPLTPAELLAANDQLHRRTQAAIRIVEAVARKTRKEHLPAGFAALLRNTSHTVHPSARFQNVQLRFPVGQSLELPIELLAASDREVAVWARERIRASRHVAFTKAKKAIFEDIAATEKRLSAVIADLERKQRELDQLGRAPRYIAPTRYPKVKKPPRA